MKLLQQLAISFFGIIFALFLFEIVFRVAGRFSAKPIAWSDRPKFYFKDEAADTLQDFAYEKVKPPNVFRIAVVGDSYSFAPYMQFTDTFTEKLQQMLNLNKVPLKAEVINYGVPAYSTSHEVAVTKKALEEGGDLVLLQITLNDAELKPYTPQGIEIGAVDRWAGKTMEDWQNSSLRHWKSLTYVLTRMHNSRTHRSYTKYFIDLFENPRSWTAFQKSFQEISDQCKEKNIKLVAVVFPLFGLPLDESYPFKVIHDKLDSFLKEKSVEHLDLYPMFRGIPLERIQVIPNEDRHPNEIGHRIAAESIYSWLEQKSLIPNELKIKARYSERMGISGKGRVPEQK